MARGLLQPVRHAVRRLAVQAQARALRPLNVILGAGSVEMPGWVATDSDVLDVRSQPCLEEGIYPRLRSIG